MTEEEIDAARQEVALLDDGTGYEAEPVPRDHRDELVATALERPGERISVVVALPDPGFDWEWFHNQQPDTEARTHAITVRQNQIDTLFADVVTDLENLGIDEVRRFWIVPFIGIDVTSPDVAMAMAQWPEERKVWIDKEYQAVPTENYTGIEFAGGVGAGSFHVGFNFRGQAGARTDGGPIRVGIVEALPEFNWIHPGLGGKYVVNRLGIQIPTNTRFGSNYRKCDQLGCTTYIPQTVGSHGTRVASVALGTIAGGEDPGIPPDWNQVEWRQRSGIAPHAKPYFYHVDVLSAQTFVKLRERAASDGIDVMNHSYERKPPPKPGGGNGRSAT